MKNRYRTLTQTLTGFRSLWKKNSDLLTRLIWPKSKKKRTKRSIRKTRCPAVSHASFVIFPVSFLTPISNITACFTVFDRIALYCKCFLKKKVVFSHDVLRANEFFGLIFRPRHTPSNNTWFFIPDCQLSVSEKYGRSLFSGVSGRKTSNATVLYFTLNNENPLKDIMKIKKKIVLLLPFV